VRYLVFGKMNNEASAKLLNDTASKIADGRRGSVTKINMDLPTGSDIGKIYGITFVPAVIVLDAEENEVGFIENSPADMVENGPGLFLDDKVAPSDPIASDWDAKVDKFIETLE